MLQRNAIFSVIIDYFPLKRACTENFCLFSNICCLFSAKEKNSAQKAAKVLEKQALKCLFLHAEESGPITHCAWLFFRIQMTFDQFEEHSLMNQVL